MGREFKPYYYIYIGGLSFLFGILFGSWLNLSWLWFYSLALVGMIVLILGRGKKASKVLALVMIFFSIGLWRWQISWPIVDQGQIAWYDGQQVNLTGQVNGEVEQRKSYQQVTLKVNEINSRPASGKLLVYLPLYPEYQYKDKLELFGEINKPQALADFSYDKYLARYNIYAISYYPQVEKIEQYQGKGFYSFILRVKKSLVVRVNRLLPEPESSFLGGLLWGAKRSIPQGVLQNFNATGTTHIVALSGYNITILGLIIFFLAPWLGIKRQQAFWLVIGIILFFIIITGYPASVVRAGIMGGLVLLAYRSGGGSKASILLVVSAVLMCFINPKVLLYDVGFQLSFLATIGLIYLSPRLEKYLAWLPRRWAVRETVLATSSAIIMTAPLVIYQFERFSLVALLANILILFIIPLTMAFGFVAVLMSFLFFAGGQAIAWLAYLPLAYIINLTAWLGSIPGASITITDLPNWLMLFFYLIIIVFIVYPYVNFFQKQKV